MEPKRLRSTRNFYLVFVYLITALAGFSRGLHHAGETNLDVAFALSLGLALALLVTSDAQLAHRALPTTAGWLIFLFWPIAAPAAVIVARQRRGVWLAVANGVLILATYAASFEVGLWLAV